jgi:hypothetical protein
MLSSENEAGGSYICMPCCRRGHSDDYSFDDDRSLDMSTSGRGDAEPAQIMRPEPALIVQPSKTRQMNPHLAHIGADPTH